MSYARKDIGLWLPRHLCKNDGYWSSFESYGQLGSPLPLAGGAGAPFIDVPLTDAGDVDNTYTGDAGDSWGFSAAGATYTRSASFSLGGSLEILNICPDTDSFEAQFVYGGGTEPTPQLNFFVLADGVSTLEPDNAWGIRVTSTQMQIIERASGANVLLDTTALPTGLAANDVFKIRVTKNGSNWDVTGYQNDTEVCSITNDTHANSAGLSDGIVLNIASVGAAGVTGIFKDVFGEVLA